MIHQIRLPSSITLWSSVQCWCFQQWAWVSIGTLTGLPLYSSIFNKLWCIVSSDTFLSEPTWTSVWAIFGHRLDRITQTSRITKASYLNASVSLGHPWPCHQFTMVPCFLVTTAVLEMFRPNHMTITIWPMSNLIISLRLPIFPVSNTTTLRTKYLLVS